MVKISIKTVLGKLDFLGFSDFVTSLWKDTMTKGLTPRCYALKVDFGAKLDLQNKPLTSTIRPHLPKISNKMIVTGRGFP